MIWRRDFLKFVAFAAAFVLFGRLRGLADEKGTPVQFRYAIDFDHWLFAGNDPVVWLQRHLGQRSRLDLLDFVLVGVYLTYFVVPPAIGLLLWWRRSPGFVPYTFSIIVTLYIGLLINFLVPTAPPWLAADAGYLPPLRRLVAEVLNHVVQGSFATGDSVGGPNDVAAMPSLHFAIICIVAFFLATRLRYGAVIGGCYMLAMSSALVYLGEHYLSDILAGFLVAALSWWLAHWFARLWSARARARQQTNATRQRQT
ncbi:MAG TPA: phosphatase PAP2 family protein [Nitrolancea sp.]|nr:phosphatase PAP2 family protein [Nitrolancea sp.]